MWSFAIWDSKKKKLFFSRDRFGIKPFYYYCNNEVFVFASEIKALLEIVPAEINKKSLYKYLYFDEKDTNHETFFRDIYQLSPGHNLVIEQNKINVFPFYNLSNNKCDEDYELSKKKFLKIFKKSIEFRNRSDVDLGYALSGGIDSSSIVKLCNELYGKERKKTFSVVFPDSKFDESRYIDDLLKTVSFDNYKIAPSSENLREDLKKFIYHNEEPVPDLSYFNDFMLKKMIKEKNVTVCLEGQGADEILAGYRSFVLPYYFDLIDKFKFKSLIKERRNFKPLYYSKLYNILIRYLLSKIRGNINTKIKMKFNFKFKKIYNENYFKKISFENKRRKNKSTNLSSALFNSLIYLSIPKLVTRGDKIAMAHSIESRFPFLDHNFVEYIFSLPDRFKIRDGITKKILRDSLKNFLPNSIFSRKDKIGFISPQTKWLVDLSDFFDSIVYSESFKETPYINWTIFEKKYSKLKNNQNDNLLSKEIWKILSVYLWEITFIKQK